MGYTPRFPNTPFQYDAKNEAEFRANVLRALQDVGSAGFIGFDLTDLPDVSGPAASGDVLVFNGTLWATTQVLTGTYTFNNTITTLGDLDGVNSTLSGNLGAVGGTFSGNVGAVNFTSSGLFLAANGSAPAPSYSFTTAPTYGMYYSSSSLNFAIAGQLEFYITTGGVYINGHSLYSSFVNGSSGWILEPGTSAYGTLRFDSDAFRFYAGATSNVVLYMNESGSIRGLDGSEGAPTYTFINESDSGLYSSGTDQIGVALGADLRFEFHASHGFKITHPTEANLRMDEEDAGVDEGLYRFVIAGGDFYLQTLTDAGAANDTVMRAYNATGIIQAIDFAAHLQVAGRSTSWGSTNGIYTGSYNSVMGTSTSATWAWSSTSGGTFRGGMQVLDGGSYARFYLGSDYLYYFGNGAGSVLLRAGSGSSSSPPYSYDGDTDTGHYLVNTGQLGVTVGGTLRTDWTTSKVTLRYSSGGGMLVLRDTGGAGTAANPFIEYRDSANVRRAWVGVSDVTNDNLVFGSDQNAAFSFRSGGNEIVQMRHDSATGSPFISWYQSSTRKTFIQYNDTGDAWYFTTDAHSIGVHFRVASTDKFVIESIDADEGRVYVANGQFYLNEGTNYTGSASHTIDWDEGNFCRVQNSSAATVPTTINVGASTMMECGSYIMHIVYGVGGAAAVTTWTGVDQWANGNEPSLGQATVGDVTVVHFHKLNSEVIGTWYQALS
jgi:hypothetical protein